MKVPLCLPSNGMRFENSIQFAARRMAHWPWSVAQRTPAFALCDQQAAFRRAGALSSRAECSSRPASSFSPRTTGSLSLRVSNSLTGAVEEWHVPQRPVTWYSCGPTVYDDMHLGHARTYVCTDIIRRILEDYFHIPLNFVMGITDIDDKILARAESENRDPLLIAREFEGRFRADMDSLGIRPPHAVARVTEHVDDIQLFVKVLLEKGFAYEIDDGIYFDTQALGRSYGAMSRNLGNPVGDQVPSGEKKNTRDFALWKYRGASESGSFTDECGSGLRPGRPGWHIECSAMVNSTIGERLDVHSGGIDLCFPHHCNEVAQSEAFHGYDWTRGDRWANIFLHIGHLHIEGRKMSKSLKNFVTMRELMQEDRRSPELFRLFCLSSHYSSNIEYNSDRLRDAGADRDRFQDFFASVAAHERAAHERTVSALGADPVHERLQQREKAILDKLFHSRRTIDNAIRDDFNFPIVLAELREVVSLGRGYCGAPDVRRGVLAGVRDFTQHIFSILGFNDLGRWSSRTDAQSEHQQVPSVALDHLVTARAQLRDVARTLKRNGSDGWRDVLRACDVLRDDVAGELGVKLEDRADGSTFWISKQN